MTIITPIDSGGIMLSYRCNCRCAHCLYACGPDWQGAIEVADVARIFEGLLATSRYLREFHIAGGEPFLDFERLLRVQRLASEFRIPIEYVETNAGWCIDKQSVREKLEQLRDSGLPCMLVSCSPFHAEGVPLDRVTTAIEVGYDVFGPNGVIVWVPEFYRELSRIRTNDTISLNEYVEAIGIANARCAIQSGYSIISGGRLGYGIGRFYDRRPAEGCAGDHCQAELLESAHAHFDPYGNLIPTFCAGISLGDALDLPALFESFDLERLPIVRILVEGGPYALYQLAVERFGYTALEEGYVGKCHLCVDVRRWIKQHTSEFAELAPDRFYDNLER
jgi:hypothetical protein